MKMLRKYRDGGDEPPKDADIQRWFQALGQPPEAQEPLGARARLLARIEQQQRRTRFAWLSSLATPVFATGLAAALVLSIGLNVWWGSRIFGTRQQGLSQVASTRETPDVTSPLSTYRFQAGLQHATELGALVAARPVESAPMPVVGFTPQAVPATTFVRLGTLYADTLAALSSGEMEAVASRLNVMAQTLATAQAPLALSQYLNEMQNLLTQQTYEEKTLAQFVALFEPLYEEAYDQAPVATEVTLFQAGTWLENLALAATVGDKAALQRAQKLQSLHESLRQLDVAPRVLSDVAQLDSLITQPVLTDQDVSTIRRLVEAIQQGLSA